MALKGYVFVGISLYRLCVPNVFDTMTGFHVDSSHVFPQCMQAAITLLGGVVVVGGSKACTGW